jgi:hypothetical protein
LYAKWALPIIAKNVCVLANNARNDVKNPIILFTFNRAMWGSIERAIIEIHFAWELVDKELKFYHKRPLGTSSQDYKDLRRMRNKLVAHKIENSLKSNKHQKWYKRKYGSYDKTFALLQRVTDKIVRKIDYLERHGYFKPVAIAYKTPIEIHKKDIDDFINALKKEDLY